MSSEFRRVVGSKKEAMTRAFEVIEALVSAGVPFHITHITEDGTGHGGLVFEVPMSSDELDALMEEWHNREEGGTWAKSKVYRPGNS